MYNSTQDMLDAFRSTPATLARLLQGVTNEAARAARGGDEGWSVVEVICHLRDAEEYGLARARLMRDHENPDIRPYDQERLAIERDYAAQDLSAALEAFTRLRREHIALLERLPAEGWDRAGNHLEIGRITIFNHTLHLACHDAIHCAQIARQLP